MLPVKFSEQSEAVHYLFYKQHTVRSPIPEKPSDRTLFVVNVLPYMDEVSAGLRSDVSHQVRGVTVCYIVG